MMHAVLILTLALVAVPGAQATCSSGRRNLDSYLADLVVDLDAESFSAYSFDITVSNLRCDSFDLGSVSSDAVDSSASTLDASAMDVGVTCNGEYSFEQSWLGWPYGSGSVSLSTSTSSVYLRLVALPAGEHGLPFDVDVSTCTALIQLSAFSFSGGLSASILNTLSSAIRPVVENTLEPRVCDKAEDVLLNVGLRQLTSALDDSLTPYLNLDTDGIATARESTDDTVAWGSWHLFRDPVEAMNVALLEAEEDHLEAAATALLNLTGVGDADGVVHLADVVELPSSFGFMDDAELHLSGIAMRGLPTLTRLQLLRPASSPAADGMALDPDAARAANVTGLVFEVSMRQLKVAAEVDLELGDAYNLCESASAAVTLEGIDVSAVVQVPVIESRMSGLTVAQVLDGLGSGGDDVMQCLLRAVEFEDLTLVRVKAVVNSLGASIEGKRSGVWLDVAHLLDNTIHLLLRDFPSPLLRALEAAVAGPITASLDESLRGYANRTHNTSSCIALASLNAAVEEESPAFSKPVPEDAVPLLNLSMVSIAADVVTGLLAHDERGRSLVNPQAVMRPILSLVTDKQNRLNFASTAGQVRSTGDNATTTPNSLSSILAINSISLSGLDNISSVALAVGSPPPVWAENVSTGEHSAYAVYVQVEVDSFTIHTDFSLHLGGLTPSSSSTDEKNGLRLHGEVDVVIRNASTLLALVVPILHSALQDNVTLDRLLSSDSGTTALRCALTALDTTGAGVADLVIDTGVWHVSGMRIYSDAAWASIIEDVLSSTLASALDIWSAEVRVALGDLASRRLRSGVDDALSALLLDSLGNASCPESALVSESFSKSIPDAMSLVDILTTVDDVLSSIQDLPHLVTTALADFPLGDGSSVSIDIEGAGHGEGGEGSDLGEAEQTAWVERIEVTGLDMLKHFVPLRGTEAQEQTVITELAFHELEASVNFRVRSGPYEEEAALSLRVNIDNPSVNTSTLVCFNQTEGVNSSSSGMTIGDLLTGSGGVETSQGVLVDLIEVDLGGTVSSAYVAVLNAAATNLSIPIRIAQVVNSALSLLVGAYGDSMLATAGMALQIFEAKGAWSLSGLFESGSATAATARGSEVTGAVWETDKGYIDWSKWPPYQVIDYTINDLLGVEGMNSLASAMLERQYGSAGSLHVNGDVITSQVDFDGRSLQMAISDVSAKSVDSFSKVDFFETVDSSKKNQRATRLESEIVVGGPGSKSLNVTALMEASYAEEASDTKFALGALPTLSLTMAHLHASVDARVDSAQLHAIHISDLFTARGLACVGASMKRGGVRIASAGAQAEEVRVRLHEHYAEGSVDVTDAEQLDVERLARAFKEADASMTDLLNGALEYLFPNVLVPIMNDGLILWFIRMEARCAATEGSDAVGPEDNSSEVPPMRVASTAVGIALVCLLCVFCVGYCVWWRRWRQRMKNELAAEKPGETTADKVPLPVAPAPCPSWFHHRSLAAQVSGVAGVSVLVLILAAMSIFGWANSQASASLVLRVTSPLGLDLLTPPVYQFGLNSLLKSIVTKGSTPVALVIALLSGVWPYVKLAGMLASWVLPDTVFPIRHREAFLSLLHAHGKWSLVDVAVVQVAMVAFHLQLSAPSKWLAGLSIASLEIVVMPESGLYGLLGGTLLSIVLSHATLAYHRGAAAREELLHRLKVEKDCSNHSAGEILAVPECQCQPSPGASSQDVEVALSGPASDLAQIDAAETATGSTIALPQHLLSTALAALFAPNKMATSERGAGSTSMQDDGSSIAANDDPSAHQQASFTSSPVGAAQSQSKDNQQCLAEDASSLRAAQRLLPLRLAVEATSWTERAKRVIAVLALPSSLGLVLGGAFIRAFQFEFSGLACFLLGGNGMCTRTFSLVEMGLALSEAMPLTGPIGVWTLTVTYFAIHLAMPLVLPMVVGVLWFVPLPFNVQESAYLFVQFVNACSGVDIFVLALVAGLAELSHLGEFVLRGRCNEINKLLELYALELLDGDATCFGITANIKRGLWLLLTSAIFAFLASHFVLARCESALELRRKADFKARHGSMPSMDQALPLVEAPSDNFDYMVSGTHRQTSEQVVL